MVIEGRLHIDFVEGNGSRITLEAGDALTFDADRPHAFHADYRPSYRKEQAEDGWKRAVAWFKAHGVA